MPTISDIRGSYRLSAQSGAVTTIAAATSSAGHIFSMRYVSSTTGAAMRIRAIEANFLLTTAFSAAQEVGFDVVAGRSFSASPTGATAIALSGNDAKKRTDHPNSDFVSGGDIRIAGTSAMTAGTVTLDSVPLVKGSFWASTVGNSLGPWRYDLSQVEPGGVVLKNNEGIIIRNTVLMGATGVGKWTFSVEWDEVTLVA
jgi:hypothetical protein